jgi:hypothetical protein
MQAAGIKPANAPKSTTETKTLLQQMQEAGIQPAGVSKSAEESPGFLQSLAQGVAKPFLRAGESVIRPLKGVAQLVTGNREGAAETLDPNREADFGYFGKVKPFQIKAVNADGTRASAGDFASSALDTAGGSIEIGSTFMGAGGAKNVIKEGVKQSAKSGFGEVIKQGVKRGVAEGAKAGLAGGFGVGLQEEGSAEDRLRSGLTGAAIGGVAGAATGGVIGALPGATRAVSRGAIDTTKKVTNLGLKALKTGYNAVGEAIPEGLAKDTAKVLEGATSKTVGFLKSVPDRVGTAAEKTRVTQAKIKALSPTERNVLNKGIRIDDIEKIKAFTPDERSAIKTIEKARSSGADSAQVSGSFLREPIEQAEALRNKIGSELGAIVKKLPNKNVPNARQKVVESLKDVQGLKNVKVMIDDEGREILDFSKTAISLDDASQRDIQKYYDAIKGRDAEGLHLLRQELFEVLGGKKSAKIQLSETSEKATNAVREGLANAIGDVSDTYKEKNKAYAKAVEPLKKLRKFFKGTEGADEDILDEQAGVLLRRLTGKSVSRSEVNAIFRDLIENLRSNGVKVKDINFKTIQEFENLLDEIYPLQSKTSFAGQTELGVSKGLSGLISKGIDVVGEAIASPEVRQKAIRELLESLK